MAIFINPVLVLKTSFENHDSMKKNQQSFLDGLINGAFRFRLFHYKEVAEKNNEIYHLTEENKELLKNLYEAIVSDREGDRKDLKTLCKTILNEEIDYSRFDSDFIPAVYCMKAFGLLDNNDSKKVTDFINPT
jgi:hypothetical protein